VTDYRFETTWRLPASRQDAWDVLFDGAGWPRWWPSVRKVDVLVPGAPDGVGRRLRYHFSTRLPYTLTFEAQVVEVAEPARLVARADGELAGTWTCDLDEDGGDVVVRHVWDVRSTRRWMNVLAPLATPLFSWNHAALMREGGQGFAAALGTTVRVDTDEPRRARGIALAATAAVVAVVPVVRAVRRRR
jgi:uncharacterized protein YndB with AHSA1/START domain